MTTYFKMHKENDEKGAGVRFPPPILLLIVLIISYVLHYFIPISIHDSVLLRYAGIGIIFFAVVVIVHVALIFKKAKTNIEPWKSTSKIITQGIFSITRNPIYLACCLILIGFALLISSYWFIFSLIPFVALIYLKVIKKEEAYLETKFGQEYRNYTKQVRRWL